jgi:hypothetical protein
MPLLPLAKANRGRTLNFLLEINLTHSPTGWAYTATLTHEMYILKTVYTGVSSLSTLRNAAKTMNQRRRAALMLSV